MAEGLAATVVGGGIAGLASAVALAQAGWRVTVLERAPAFGEVGAGLAITRNGMTALDAIGAGEAVRAAGHATVPAGQQDPSGRWMLRLPDRHGPTTIWGLHRQRLHAALLRAAEAEGVALVTGAEVTGVRPGHPGGEPAVVTWRAADGAGDANGAGEAGGADGEGATESGLVVAADGVWSAVRATIFPGIRAAYSGSTSWRAVIPDSTSEGRLLQVWGPETEFGAVRVQDDEIYWYGYFRHPEGASFPDELAAAREKFRDWSPRVREIVAATTPGRLMRHDVYHLPNGTPSYVSGRVVLTGDAAHAMLPTAGQGASTALEDGVCVGRLIGAAVTSGGDLGTAMRAYDEARRPRCRQIARVALLTGRFGADLGPGARQTLRNTLLRLLPAGTLSKAGATLLDWTAP